ncbi:MAG: hypothetical protein Q8L86_10040 [Vicinamibacterales bacterium]|nr:hypothetical protein [Vicinamibacterales bacterium]
MADFNATNPVTVGAATRKSHYDRSFNNTLALREGSVALDMVTLDDNAAADVAPANEARVRYHEANGQLELSKNGGGYQGLASTGKAIAMAIVFGG